MVQERAPAVHAPKGLPQQELGWITQGRASSQLEECRRSDPGLWGSVSIPILPQRVIGGKRGQAANTWPALLQEWILPPSPGEKAGTGPPAMGGGWTLDLAPPESLTTRAEPEGGGTGKGSGRDSIKTHCANDEARQKLGQRLLRVLSCL